MTSAPASAADTRGLKPLRRRLQPGLWLGVILVGIVLLLAVTGAVWTPYNPMALSIPHRLQPPSDLHWLGTDEFGRDVLSRLMSGATTSVSIGLATVAVATVLGAPIGVLAGFLGGAVDRLLISADRVLVVDYKTDRPPPSDPDRVARHYLRQMAAYRAVLRRIYPGRRVETALVWTDGPSLMHLPDRLLDRWAPDPDPGDPLERPG